MGLPVSGLPSICVPGCVKGKSGPTPCHSALRSASQSRWGSSALEDVRNGAEQGGGRGGRCQLGTGLQRDRKRGPSSDLLVSGWPFLRDGCLSLFISILKKGGALTDVGTLGAPGGSSGSQHPHLRLPICSWPAASLVRYGQRLRSPRPAPPWSSLWARSILFCLAHLLIL